MDYSKEMPTLVEFRFEKTKDGTLLILTESGFGKIPISRRAEAFRMNGGGLDGANEEHRESSDGAAAMNMACAKPVTFCLLQVVSGLLFLQVGGMKIHRPR
jgi:hypothetical protein